MNTYYVVMERWDERGSAERKSIIKEDVTGDYQLLNSVVKEYPGWIIVFFKRLVERYD